MFEAVPLGADGAAIGIMPPPRRPQFVRAAPCGPDVDHRGFYHLFQGFLVNVDSSLDEDRPRLVRRNFDQPGLERPLGQRNEDHLPMMNFIQTCCHVTMPDIWVYEAVKRLMNMLFMLAILSIPPVRADTTSNILNPRFLPVSSVATPIFYPLTSRNSQKSLICASTGQELDRRTLEQNPSTSIPTYTD